MFHRLTSELVIRSPWRPFRARHGDHSLIVEGRLPVFGGVQSIGL